MMQSQVMFNRVPDKAPEKVPEKVPGGFGADRVRFNSVPEKVPEKVWEALVQSQFRFNRISGHLSHGNPAEVFPALSFAKRCGCWGYHRTLFSILWIKTRQHGPT